MINLVIKGDPMENEMVIYRPGTMHINTTVVDGICAYTGGLSVAEYIDQQIDGFVCIPFDDALKQIREVEESNYIHQWEEISKKTWDTMLEVMPPEKWENYGDVEIFRMCEYEIGNITSHYARCKNKYFAACRRTTDGYREMIPEINLAYVGAA